MLRDKVRVDRDLVVTALDHRCRSPMTTSIRVAGIDAQIHRRNSMTTRRAMAFDVGMPDTL